MPLSALLLALAAAFVHAFWNLLLARARDPEAATAVALIVAVVVFAPVSLFAWSLEREVWPYLVVTSCLQLLYFSLLITAYRRAEMSVVYPVARGVAPTLVLLAGVVILGYSTSWAQAAGVVLVGLGVLAIRGVRRGAGAADRLRARDRRRDRLVHARRQARARLREPDRLPRGLDDRAGHPLRSLGGPDARRRRGAAERAQSLFGRRRDRDLHGLRARARGARSSRPQPRSLPCARRASSSRRCSRPWC